MQKAVIIIPTYNEKDNICQTLEAVLAVCQSISNFQMQVLVVDSNSPDGTADLIQAKMADHPNLALLVEPQKKGLGHAYMHAMYYAINSLMADIVFEFDADGSHQTRYIPLFLEEITQGADVVVGSRYVKGGSIPREWARYRKGLSRVGNLVVRLFLTRRYKDWTSGFRATRVTYLKKIAYTELLSPSYAYKLHLFWLLHKAHAKIIEHPIEFLDRKKGYSKLPTNNVFESLALVIRLRLYEMRYFIKMCLVGVCGAALQLLIFNFLRVRLSPAYANSIAVEISIISGFMLNHFFAFHDKRLMAGAYSLPKVLMKFASYNGLALGSLLIQFTVLTLGIDSFGRGALLENSLVILGILIGAVYNYFIYSRIIWKYR